MQRILQLDFVRGIAVLGILLMNISGFGLPGAAYLNPAWHGTPSTSDFWTWAILDITTQVKFLSLFAILFGASLAMLIPRGGRFLFSRLGWLVVIGLMHSVFFWEGDILLDYGLIGLFVWRFIAQVEDNDRLLRTGIFLYFVGALVLIPYGLVAGDNPGSSWLPGPSSLEYEQFWKVQSGSEALLNRIDMLSSGIMALLSQYGWQLAGAMMAGAALLRNGWLTGERTSAVYRRQGIILILAGVAIQLPGLLLQIHLQWAWPWAPFFLQIPRDLGAPLQGLGYVALLYSAWHSLSQQRWVGWISLVGRMALSNYLLQTLICTTLFYRLGGFMQFDRLQLLAMVPAIWCVNLLFSHLWLRRFRQGPMEALWRQLTRFTAGASVSSPK